MKKSWSTFWAIVNKRTNQLVIFSAIEGVCSIFESRGKARTVLKGLPEDVKKKYKIIKVEIWMKPSKSK